MKSKTILLLTCIALTSALCFAGKQFMKPVALAASSYPAHDSHPNEKLSVAVDPYDMPDKAQAFSTPYQEMGYLPVFFVITNDSDEVISLGNMKAQLLTRNRTKLFPATNDDLYRRLSRPAQASNVPNPLPLPRKRVKGGVSKKQLDEMDAAQFAARAVEPHTTHSGFLFFDITGISTPLAGATFFLTGVTDGTGHEFMYFEIPLEKYLSAPATPPAAKP